MQGSPGPQGATRGDDTGVAKKAHQKGPLMPYLYATLQLCSSVAALQPAVECFKRSSVFRDWHGTG